MSDLWAKETPFLRCVRCCAGLQPAETDGLRCVSCQTIFPIRDEILDVGRPQEGNNRVVADFYDGPRWQRSKFWEWLFFLFHGGERRARHQVMQYAPPLSGKRLLIVAIGAGNELESVPADCTVAGIDISMVQLGDCRRRYSDRNLRLILGEAEKLPYREGVFDHALSVGGFNYFTDPLGALREMARVVKPGGTILVSDEVPKLAQKMTTGPIRRRLLRRQLGPEFADIVNRHINLELEPIVRQVLRDWTIHSVWRGSGYCIVGQSPGAAP
jgi:ubiquinone/menaquinone biosynthesis C-methylase UbiE